MNDGNIFGAGMDLGTPEPLKGEDSWKLDGARVRSALRWRNTERNGPVDWVRFGKLYEGDHWEGLADSLFKQPSSESPRDRITVNVTQRTVLNYMAFLVRQKSECVLRGKTPQAMADAPAATGLINHFWREAGYQDVYSESVLDGLIIGHGVVATGFVLELDEASNRRAGDLNYDDRIKKDSPTARRVSPHFFLWDPQAPSRDLRTARWAAEIFFLPITDLVWNSNFSSAVRGRIRAGQEAPERLASFLRMAFDGRQASWMQSDPDEDYSLNDLVVCVHYWDKKNRKYRLYALGIDEPLIEEDWKYPELDGFPYLKWGLVPIPDRPFEHGLVRVGEDQQLELNRTRTTEYITRRKYALRKWVALQNALTATEAEKLMNDTDELILSALPPEAAIKLMEAPSAPSDNARVSGQIMEDRRQLLGEDELLTGGQLPSRTSAAEIHQRQSNIGLMSKDRQARVDKHAESMWRHLYQLCRRNIRRERLVEIAGIDGEEAIWQPVTPEVLQQEFEFEVLTTSREDYNPETERGQRTAIFQTALQSAPSLAQAGVQVPLGELWDWMMQSFPQRARLKMIFGQIPPPPGPGAAPAGEGSTGAPGDAVSSGIQAASVPAGAAQTGAQLGG